jgi:DNA integrity scanning protein DisA with diadenylate cyclase activity
MLFLLPYTEYLRRMIEPRNVADIIFVFLLVYAVLKLLRGTRAAPMAAGIAFLVFLYWLSVKQDLATLEFVLSNGLLYIGIAIIVLFQSEIRQALISFGNRFRVPFSRHRGQFGEGVYDEIILAATTLASTKTGALVVIERNVGLKNVTDGGVPRWRGRRPAASHRSRFMLSAADTEPASLARSRHTTSRGDRGY